MKRYPLFALMAALVLSGAMLTGCGSKNDSDHAKDDASSVVSDDSRSDSDSGSSDAGGDDSSRDDGVVGDVEDLVTDAEDGVRDIVTDAENAVDDMIDGDDDSDTSR